MVMDTQALAGAERRLVRQRLSGRKLEELREIATRNGVVVGRSARKGQVIDELMRQYGKSWGVAR